MVIVIMGVCGCGKSTIGKMLAERIGVDFFDGDEFHPKENVTRMAAGIPLNDDDRKPWLETMAGEISKWESKGGAVLACSALRESYRQILKNGGDVLFVHLKGSPETILGRMKERNNHFMPASLVKSQFETLEEPQDGISIDITFDPEEIVKDIIEKLETKKRN